MEVTLHPHERSQATARNEAATTMTIIGKTGTGKSATCNTILQTDQFEEGEGGLSKTSDCKQMEKTAWGRHLCVIDTPGTFDVTDGKRALDELLKSIDLCPAGLDAFLLTFRCDVRVTEEEITAAEQAIDTFGPECYRRAIVVFTHGKAYKNDCDKFKTALDKTRRAVPRFDKLLSKLDNRWVLLDNRLKPKNQKLREQQVRALLNLVDQVALSNPRRYKKEDQQLVLRQRAEIDSMLMQLERGLFASQILPMMMFASVQLRSREMEYALEHSLMQRLQAQLELQHNIQGSKCTIL